MAVFVTVVFVCLFFLGSTTGSDVIPVERTVGVSFDDVYRAEYLTNTNCSADFPVVGWCPAWNDTSPTVMVAFKSAALLTALIFHHVTGSCQEETERRTPDWYMETCNLTYYDIAEGIWKNYEMPLFGLNADERRTTTNLTREIITDKIIIRPVQSFGRPCFGLTVYGYELSDNKIAVYNMSFLSISNNSLITPLDPFNVTGNVTLEMNVTDQYDTQPIRNLIGRRDPGHHGPHHDDHHHGHTASFNGHHCSVRHPHPNHHNNHPPGHNNHGSLPPPGGPLGFSCTSATGFGPQHKHNAPFYLLDSHNTQLIYKNQNLCANVYSGPSHWLVCCPFQPVTSRMHQVGLSFQDHHGVSILVDGHKLCEKKTPDGPHGPPHNSQAYICMGHCQGSHNSNSNAILQGPICHGASQQNLISAGLQPKLATTTPAPTPPPTAKPKTTVPPTSTPTTTAVTTTQSTTSQQTSPTVTTLLTTIPTTTARKPRTATAYHAKVRPTNSSVSSPICYDCSNQPQDGTCAMMKKCQQGEVCTVFKDVSGFTHKCLDKTVCELSQKLTSDCFHCCSSDFCNKKCPVPCNDSPNCSLLKSSGYNACGNPSVAKSICKKSCHIC